MQKPDLQLVNTFTFPDRSYRTCNDCNLYEKTIRRLTISPDRRFLYGYRYGLYDDAFRPDNADNCEIRVSCLIEVQTGDVLSEEEIYYAHDNLPCAFSPDSQFLAFYDGTICIARLQDFHKGRKDRLDASSYQTGLTSVTFKPDSTRLTPNNLFGLTSVTFSPDGLRVAARGNNKTIYICNLTTGEQKTILTGHSNAIRSVAFSPDGLTLASGSQDNTIHLWDLANYEQKTILTRFRNYYPYINSIAFSSDSLTLTTGSRRDISFWNLESY
jgi:WD40 repeat protein